jgi:hypothetical protein
MYDWEVLEDLAEAIALRDRLDARIAGPPGSSRRRGGWGRDASASMVAWLRANARMTRRSAQRLRSISRPARPARVRPGLCRGSPLGRSGRSHRGPPRRRADRDPRRPGGRARPLPHPADRGRGQPGHERLAGPGPARASEPAEPDRALHLSQTLDDRWVLDGTLDPEAGATVARRADAMVDICRFFLDHQRGRAGGRHRPHVNVVVELDDLEAGRGGRVVDGPGLDGPTVSRLLCDCALHRVVMSGRSAILDYGVSTRTIPAPRGPGRSTSPARGPARSRTSLPRAGPNRMSRHPARRNGG